MSAAYCYHFDPTYFPEPEQFRPDRWLSVDAPQLESRLVTFSRGPRSCLGINLAHAELYLTLEDMASRYNIELCGTTEKDMQWKDNFVLTINGHLKVRLSPAHLEN